MHERACVWVSVCEEKKIQLILILSTSVIELYVLFLLFS